MAHVVRRGVPISSGTRGIFLLLLEGLVAAVEGALLIVASPIVVEFCQPEEVVGARRIRRGRRGDEIAQSRESRLCPLYLLDGNLLRHHTLGVGGPLFRLLKHTLARRLGRKIVVLDLRLALVAGHLCRGRRCKRQQ